MKKLVSFIIILLLITNVYAFSFGDKISSFSIKDALTSFSVIDFFNKLFGIKENIVGINIESDSKIEPTETPIVNQPVQDTSNVIEQPVTNIQEIEEPVEDSSGVINIITQEPITITQEEDNINQAVPVPILNGYLSVATLKQSYSVNEVIELTDPPTEKGFFSNFIESIKKIFRKEVKGEEIYQEQIKDNNLEPLFISDQLVSFNSKSKGLNNLKLSETSVYNRTRNYTRPNFKGYIIKYKEKSVGERRVELINKKESNIDQNLLNYKSQLEEKHEEYDNVLSSRINNYNNKKKFDYYLAFNGISLDINSYEVSKIKDLDFIESINPNYQVEALLRDSIPIINADDVWNLGYTGEGIKIAIIDTGIDYTHEDLGGCFGVGCRVEGGYNFIDENYIILYYGLWLLEYCQSLGCNLNPEDPMDDDGHGTHVSGIAAGDGIAGDGLPIKGVAPNATLYGYKVLDILGFGYDSTILASFEYVLDPNQDGNLSDHLDIASMSLGGDGSPDDIQSLAVDNMVDNGVIVVISAGNSGGYGYNTIKSPGTSRKAITVGASTKQDEIAYYSSKGSTVLWTVKPDVVAPGGASGSVVDEKICAARWPEFYAGYLCIDNNHIALAGTSMAAPHVAGAAALIKQAHPDWTPDEVKYALRNTAIDLEENILTQGYGRIDVLEAISSSRPLIVEFNKTFENEDLIDFSAIVKVNSEELYDDYIIEFNIGYMGEQFINYPFAELQDPSDWLSEFYFQDSIIINNNEPFIVDLPLINKRDINIEGIYLIKIYVKNIGGEIVSQDSYTLLIENTKILYPVTSDVYGKYFEFFGSINLTDLERYTLEYSSDNIIWDNDGVTLTNNGMQFINNGVLGEFNSPVGFEKGIYLFRVHVYLNNGVEQTKLIGSIYIDPTFRDGFPKFIPFIRYYPPLFEDFIFDPSYITPVIEDINNDGQKEIIIFAANNSYDLNQGSLIYIYDNNMNLINKFSLDEGYYLPNRKSLSVGDLNGDGEKEIIVIATHSSLNIVSIFVYSVDGERVSSRDLDYSRHKNNLQTHLIIDDLNGDNEEEIILYTWNESFIGKLDVLDDNLFSLDGWPKDYIGNAYESESFTSGFKFLLNPAIGNFDEDDEKEIVIVYNNHTTNSTTVTSIVVVSILNVDGSFVNKWEILNPSWMGGSYYTVVSSSPVVGDIDDDGSDDIIIETSLPQKTYIFNRYGEILGGWPQEGSEIITIFFEWQLSKAPSLAKINDNFIIVAMDKVYNSDGSLIVDLSYNYVPGDPDYDYCGHTYSSVIADVDNDGEIEIICTQFYNYSTFYIEEPEFFIPWDPMNGEFTLVHAKNLDGTNINGFPKFIPNSRPLNSNNILDIDNDGDLELVSTSAGLNVFLSPYFFNGYGPQYPPEIEGRSSVYIWDLDSNTEENIEWSTAHHDMQRTGRYVSLPTPPIYTLTASPLSGVAPLNVSFNLSGSFSPNALIEWHFGDEVILNSLTSISYTFENFGIYNVYAIIRNNPLAPPHVYEISNNLTIIVESPSTFILMANQTSGVAPLSVLFSINGDFLIGTQFIWDFGDSTQTTTTNTIQHTYQNEGNYNAYVKIIQPNINPVFTNSVNINVLPKSKIQNTGSNIIRGYLLMKIQKNNNGVWQDYNIIVNDLQTGTLRTINGNSYLALDEIWNVNNVNINLVGDYRVYAALLNSNGNVIQTQQGGLEDYYEFIVNPYVQPINQEMME